jgi:hypothetical protein
MRSYDFLQTLGVNTHIGSDPYNDPTQLAALLSYLGIGNVRQTAPIDATSYAETAALGQAGPKIDLVINGGGPVDLTGAMANVIGLAPYLNAVENVNEVNIYPVSYGGQSGVDAAILLQKDLYAAVHGNASLAGIPVLMFTIGGADPDAFPQIGDLSAYADYANIHSYPPQALRPIFVIHAAIDGGRTDAPSKPVMITETGYYTLTNGVGWGGIPESLQASYLLDELLDEAAAGVKRTYLYDLIDDGTDLNNQEDHFGLFRHDGTAKPAATAIHNLTTLLADTGAGAATFTPAAFSYTADGIPYDYTGNSMVLDKSDGSHIIALWNEEQLWDTTSLTALPATTHNVTLTLDKLYDTVKVYDPTIGTAPIETLTNVRQLSLAVVDHPLLVDVGVNAPAASNLKLSMAEDAYKGDAQFILAIDGKQVAGPLSVTTAKASGRWQTFDFSEVLTAGSHTVAISFINDLYGGHGLDRNLYIGNVSLNGSSVSSGITPLYWNKTATFTVVAPSS